jgi:hypothetical protein
MLTGAAFAPKTHTDTEILAQVDGFSITADDVYKPLAAQLRKFEGQVYYLKRQRLDALINDGLLEKEAGRRMLGVPARYLMPR